LVVTYIDAPATNPDVACLQQSWMLWDVQAHHGPTPQLEVIKMQARRPSANQAGALVTVPPLAATEPPSLGAVFRQELGTRNHRRSSREWAMPYHWQEQGLQVQEMGRRERVSWRALLLFSQAGDAAVFWPHTSGISRVSAGSCKLYRGLKCAAPGPHPARIRGSSKFGTARPSPQPPCASPPSSPPGRASNVDCLLSR
jgi:hypothetical protein